MSAYHNHDVPFDATDHAYRNALMAVIVINAVMFVWISGGALVRSQALQADALDFFC